MSDFGLTDQGFVIKTQDDLRSQLDEGVGEVAPSLPLGDETFAGHLNGLLSLMYAELWQLGQMAFSTRDPDGATKTRLAAVSAITGTTQLPARPSTVVESICGVPGTLVPEGTAATTGGIPHIGGGTVLGTPGRRFHTIADGTIASVAGWVATTSYNVNDQVTNASRVYRCITGGVSAGSGGPGSTADDITDGTVHWVYVGEGIGEVDVVMNSDDIGPIVAVAKDLSLIVTPVLGMQSMRNLADATLGAQLESDGDLRFRRQQELAAPGTSPKDAIRADLLEVGKGTTNPVTSAFVYMNVEDIADSDGVPPHGVECVVIGGADQDIYDQLLLSVAAGIRTHGTSSGTAIDTEGKSQAEQFTRPAQFLIYARVSLEYDATLYPSDGDTEVKGAIATAFVGSLPGVDAVPSKVGNPAFTVAGVDNVTQVLLFTDVIGTPVAWAATTGYSATVGARSVVTNDGGRAYICITSGTSAGSGGPSGVAADITDGTVHWAFLGNKIAIGSRQQAAYDVSRIAVVSSAVAP